VLTSRLLSENPAVDVAKMDGKRRGIFSVKLPEIRSASQHRRAITSTVIHAGPLIGCPSP
jgi:hypothetical protein